ncbi:MAG: DUF2220 family protein [Acidimicrobiia bacterium]|nr:DUF2220 family protein [Acidimicrobiia bacterium]
MTRARADSVGESAPGWTTVADLLAKLRARWQRGTYLRAHAHGSTFEPISLPIRAPKTADLTDRLDDVRDWVERFDRDNHTGTARQVFDLNLRILRTRTIGDTQVPVRAHVTTFQQLHDALGTGPEVDALDRVLELTNAWDADESVRAATANWISDHPLAALQHTDAWSNLLSVVGWITDNHHDRANLDIRHLDVPAVDTKFVDRHRKILGRLLEHVVPADQVDRTARTFAGRFGFRERSSYVRLRLLDQLPELPAVITEVELRVDELAGLPLSVTTVFIVENRASYLAFPLVPNAVAIFGEGFGVTVLDEIPWLRDRELIYWGDIDTHGFAILDRLRKRVPTVTSILMDRTTLLDHLDHVVVEEQPTDALLDALTGAEASLYQDLIEDRFGHQVRLEQERIRFSALRRALAPWTSNEELDHPA